MSTVAAPHQGLGVAQYMWSSSPLRRYVDMVNQRQIIAMLRDGEPAYPETTPRCTPQYAISTPCTPSMASSSATWNATGACAGCSRNKLKWKPSPQPSPALRARGQANRRASFSSIAIVLRENLVKLTDIPLVFRAPSLPELPANTRVQLAIVRLTCLI